MPPTVWLNGRLLDRTEARISAFDAGFQHSVGLFETMHGAAGRVFRLNDHLARLQRSAYELGLTESLRMSALAEAVQMTLDRSELATGDAHARVRLTVTGGDLNLLASSGRGPVDPTIMISVTPATQYPEDMFARGVGVLIAPAKANPLNPSEGHKTLNYWWRMRALQEASAARMGEAIILQISNHLAGGAVSNIFLVRDGTLLTPIAHTEEEPDAMPSPVLPGITRQTIIELADAAGIGTGRQMLHVGDLLEADEIFLTNSSWGVLPVVRVEKEAIGDGTPGPVTTSLREAWVATIADPTLDPEPTPVSDFLDDDDDDFDDEEDEDESD